MQKIRWLSLFLFVAFVIPLVTHGQVQVQGTITTAATICSPPSSGCVQAPLPVNSGSVSFNVSGTFSGTLQFEVSIDGKNFASVTAYPPSSTSGVTSTTGTGTWTASVAGFSIFQVRASVLSSGSALVSIQSSQAISVSTLTAGGGGGGGCTTGGDVSGPCGLQEVVGILAQPLPSLSTGFLNWTGSVWAFSAAAGSGTPCTTTALSIQYNNAGAFGCEPDFTFTAPHTLAIGASGIFNIASLTASELVFTDSSKNIVSGTALPNGTTATTQTVADNTTKVATDAFVIANAGTFNSPMTTLGDTMYENATPAAARLAGCALVASVPCTLISTPTSGPTAAAPAWSLAGVPIRASTCTSNADTILAADRAGYVSWTDSSPCAVALAAAGSAGFTSNFVMVGCDIGAGTATITPTTSTISYSNGVTYTSAASTLALATGQCAWIYSDGSNYFAIFDQLSNLGTPTTLTLTNATGLPTAGLVNNAVTAAKLATQYSKSQCIELWGGSGTSFAMTSGDDAISNNSCYNDSGVTRTITALKCRSDNAANTTVLTPTFGSAGTGTAILTGTLTCGNSYAYSSTGTLNNTAWTTGTGIDPGMSTVGNATSIAMIVEYTF